MALELQRAAVDLVREIHGGEKLATPDWLLRPGRGECGRRWPLIKLIYHELTDTELPETMPPRERRQVDLVMKKRGQPPRIVEIDEVQHFNHYRAITLRAYPRGVRVAFPRPAWIVRSQSKARLEGGGFAKPRPPLFPGEGGRHRQRAFRDALADIVPLTHGWAPTLRIADFEVESWIHRRDAKRRMRTLLTERLS